MKYNVLFLSLFLAACGGGSLVPAHFPSGAYSGSGIGNARLKTITTTNDISETWTTSYFYDAPSTGRLSSIVTNGNPEGDLLSSFEYGTNNDLLKKIMVSGVFAGLVDQRPYREELDIEYGSALSSSTQKNAIKRTTFSLAWDIDFNMNTVSNYIYDKSGDGLLRLQKINSDSTVNINASSQVYDAFQDDLVGNYEYEEKLERIYEYDHLGRVSKLLFSQEHERTPNLNNTPLLNFNNNGSGVRLNGNGGTTPQQSAQISRFTVTTSYTYNSKEQLESEFSIEDWNGAITHRKKEYVYKNGRVQSLKTYVKYLGEESATEENFPGAVVIGSTVSNVPYNEWILKSTSAYEYETGDCFYHYPEVFDYLKSTDLRIVCPK